MKVKAADGLLVPKEFEPRSYIGQEPEDIEVTDYYIRRLATGELVEADEPAAPVATKKAKA